MVRKYTKVLCNQQFHFQTSIIESLPRDMDNITASRPLNYKVPRQALLGMTLSLILVYGVFLIWLPVVGNFLPPVFVVPFFAAYNIIEASLFFGCNQFSHCTMLSLRIIFVLTDFGYFITFAMLAEWSYKDSYMIASCFFFAVAMCLEIAIMIVFSKLPRQDCCCQSPPTIQIQVILPNQTVHQSRVRHEKAMTSDNDYDTCHVTRQ